MATVAERPPTAPEQARAAERRRRRRRSAWRRQLVALAFMSPWVIGFCAFYLYPILASLYFSFTKYDLLSDPVWVGFANYRFMFTSDGRFWTSVANTLWVVAVIVPLQILFGIGTALAFVLLHGPGDPGRARNPVAGHSERPHGGPVHTYTAGRRARRAGGGARASWASTEHPPAMETT